MQARQHKTIATVSLDPFACFPWNHRRCDNLAIPAEVTELPMDPISACACLLAKREMRVSFSQLPNQLFGRLRCVGNLPNIANFTSVRIGYRNRNRRLVNIHPNELAKLLHDVLSSIAALSLRFFGASSLTRVA
jgi:hypothetical protein